MDYRRLQHSYPPRPSPLGASQEPRDPHFTAPSTESRQEIDKSRPYPSPASNATSSPSQLYQSATSHTSNTPRGDTSSAYFPRNGPTQAHRRHGSLETRNHEQMHRRNNSQPQAPRYREGLLGASIMNNTPSQHEPARLNSQGNSGNPGFPGPNEQPAPSAFGNRQMPPPSPPHSYSARPQSTHAPVGSLMARDVPSSQALRPGSSMSISAMLGSDPDRSAREPARESAPFFSRPPASSIFSNAPSSSSAAMSPPNAPTRPSPLENSFFRRSNTPEKPFSKPQGARTYRSGSGGGSTVGGEQSVFGGLTRSSLSQYPEKPHSTHPSPRISTAEPPYNEPRRMSLNGPITRPSSQPPHADAPTRPPGYSPISQPGGVADRPFESGPRPASGSYGSHDPQHGRFANIFGERRSEDTAQRERERAPAHGSDAKLTQPGSYRYGSHYGERDSLDRHQNGSTWDLGRSHPPSPESKRFPAPEPGSSFGFGAIQSYTKSLGSQPGGRQPRLTLQSLNSQPTPPPPHDPYLRHQGQPPRISSTPAITTSTAAASSGLAALADEGRRKGSDELLHHRSLLAVGVDGKRGGRASPLPQAVQGAQAPYIGPAGEPAIKNELGRVFSGIGSGVGGVTATTGGSGPSTPLGSSPFKRDSLTGRSMNGEGMDEASKLARPSSAAGRRSKKSRDEEQMEIESNDARGVLSARNARRSRHSHHHHHHHHHHRHKADEEAATLSSLQRSSFFHRTSPAESPAAHHHHPHYHHHHHHVPRLTIPVTSPIREPRTTVNLEPLLSSVAHLPRHHLGSTLYTPRISTPTAKSSLDSSKFGYTSTPQPLPRFEQRENCTFTVRVPRFRINQSHREEICARRALWGTGVYTDDSDPVAAAIHSGFIRGAWGDDVDESMLDLEIRDTYQHAPPPETTPEGEAPAKGPRLPPIPPTDKDLHITLLILPRLAQYDSTLMFGLKSRKWDGRHDGMSFKIHAVDWVDEGVARGEERSGEARRKRLRTLMQTGRICTGPAMAKMDELRRSGVQVPRAIDGQDQPAAVQPVS
ncbi:Histone deacetylation protein Rxt3 [Penicillium roqueforti FM164]|uniref:Histone deacetylation protein Rxt3 n=2 Tax=Penicillium roqueforti TaxID=5082 RepID=W6QK55_PENRF|nr:Histone deacetylation protein Rxt3 [Penicillium roqueforti FM164]